MGVVKRAEPQLPPAGGRRGSGWIIASSIALLATARWLSATSVEYLVLAATATAVAGALVSALDPPNRRWAVASLGALALALALGANTQTELARLTLDWPAERARMRDDALERLQSEVTVAARELRAAAGRAITAPADRGAAFEHLAGIAADGIAVVLFRDGAPLAWTGYPRVAVDSLVRPLGVTASPFYLSLYAVQQDGARRAVAVTVLYTVSPADRITSSLAGEVAHDAGIRGFRFSPLADADLPGDARRIRAEGQELFAATVESLTQGEV